MRSHLIIWHGSVHRPTVMESTKRINNNIINFVINLTVQCCFIEKELSLTFDTSEMFL